MLTNSFPAVSANWLAYSDTLKPEDIAAACVPLAHELAREKMFSVELPIAHLDAGFPDLSASYFERIRQPFDDSGITISSVHGPVFSFDRFPLEDEKQRMRAYARAAVALGAKSLVVHPVLHPNLHVCSVAAAALKRDAALTDALIDELQGSSCRLAIENVPHNSWAYLTELFKHLPDEAGMCFDTGHFLVRPEAPIDQLLRQFASRISCFHLNDNHGLCDAHLPPGDGIFPWVEFFALARNLTPDATMILEMALPCRCDDPEADAVTRSALRDALGKVRNFL